MPVALEAAAVGVPYDLQQQKPDLTEQISGLEFCVLVRLQARQLLQFPQDLPLHWIGIAQTDQIQIPILNHRIQVFGFKYTFEMTA